MSIGGYAIRGGSVPCFRATNYAQLTSSVGCDLGLTYAMRVLMYCFTLWSNTCEQTEQKGHCGGLSDFISHCVC